MSWIRHVAAALLITVALVGPFAGVFWALVTYGLWVGVPLMLLWLAVTLGTTAWAGEKYDHNRLENGS